jgi:hypothetical protein
MKFHHAMEADAGPVARFHRKLREQFFGKFNFGTPARPFVSGGGAKLAIVWFAAQRAFGGIELFGSRGIHLIHVIHGIVGGEKSRARRN